jgi:biopolymer transport protein ExbD/biopolymer transport protein TolR
MSNHQLGGSGLRRPLAEINVTPLVDVMLVLLIVFMITAPMLATGLKVDLPQTKTNQTVNPKDPIVVSVEADGNLAVGTERVPLSALIALLRPMVGDDTNRIIQIRADKGAPYGAVVGVIDELATNGLVHVALISDPRRGDGPGAAPAQRDAGQTDTSPRAK